jgi:hypothetical protein
MWYWSTIFLPICQCLALVCFCGIVQGSFWLWNLIFARRCLGVRFYVPSMYASQCLVLRGFAYLYRHILRWNETYPHKLVSVRRGYWLCMLAIISWVLANIGTESSYCLWKCDRGKLRILLFVKWFAQEVRQVVICWTMSMVGRLWVSGRAMAAWHYYSWMEVTVSYFLTLLRLWVMTSAAWFLVFEE